MFLHVYVPQINSGYPNNLNNQIQAVVIEEFDYPINRRESKLIDGLVID